MSSIFLYKIIQYTNNILHNHQHKYNYLHGCYIYFIDINNWIEYVIINYQIYHCNYINKINY